MKTIKLVSIVSWASLAFLNVAQAEIEWVTTPFWTAPKKQSVVIELVPADRNKLEKSCKEFKKRLDGEITPYDVDIFNSYRMKDYSSDDEKFKAIFFAQSAPFEVSADVSTEGEKLPFYTQVSSNQTLIFTNETTFVAKGSADSYTSTAAALKLGKSPVYFESFRNQDAIVIEGKDVACDLLNNKSQLESSVSTHVEIGDDAKQSLNNFYLDKVLPNVNDVFKNRASEGSTIKAALLGFKLGKVLEERSNNDEKQTISQLKSIFGVLFAQNTLENSINVSTSANGRNKEINLPLSVESITITTLKMQVKK
jgi:hypothetical protein